MAEELWHQTQGKQGVLISGVETGGTVTAHREG